MTTFVSVTKLILKFFKKEYLYLIFKMDKKINKGNQQIILSQILNQTEDIVISGVGGRFPMSNNIDEFANNLFNNIDMITEDDNEERWPKGMKYYLNLN